MVPVIFTDTQYTASPETALAMTQEPIEDGGTDSINMFGLFFEAEISGNIPAKYGPKYGTNVPPFSDPGIPIENLPSGKQTVCYWKLQFSSLI